jgi:hypothetical protein
MRLYRYIINKHFFLKKTYQQAHKFELKYYFAKILITNYFIPDKFYYAQDVINYFSLIIFKSILKNKCKKINYKWKYIFFIFLWIINFIFFLFYLTGF